MKKWFLWQGLVVLPLLLTLGCSGGEKPIKVEGEVKLDGKPLENAMILFTPEDKGTPASGTSGSDGSFRLTTYSSGDGIKPGTYKVTVTLTDLVTGDGTQAPNMNDPKAMAEAMKKFAEKNKNKPAAKKPSLPASYSDVSKTTLKQVIPPPEGKIVLDLRSSGS